MTRSYVVRYYSYDEIEREIKDFVDIFYDDFRGIGCVVGVLRGGVFPAMVLADALDAWLAFVDTDGNIYGPCPKNVEKVLVDDVWATGKTLSKLKRLTGIEKTFVLVYDDERNEQLNDFPTWVVLDSEAWVLFPWDLRDFMLGNAKGYSRDRL